MLGKTATAASDLYSVGVIAFELLTGAVPFAETGGGSAMLIAKVNQKAPPSPLLARPELDKRLAEWVGKLLERDPGRRPRSAAAARETLEDVAESAFGPRWRRDALLPEGQPEPQRAPGASTAALLTFSLFRRRLVGALARPSNIAVGVAVAIAGLVLDVPWLYLVAVLSYLAVAATGCFEPGPSRRR